MQKTIILSPHFDDAVFSCWHLLDKPKVSVVTVFAGKPKKGTSTLWDRVCGEADSETMIVKRIKENETILRSKGIKIYNLSYLDKQYRQDKINTSTIVNSLLKQFTETGTIFYAPLAGSRFWRHPDHVDLREIGKELLKNGRSVYFYADIPYMQMPNNQYKNYIKETTKRATKLLGFNVSTLIIELNKKDQLAKVKAMKQYKTQYKMTNLISFGTLSRKANYHKEIVFKT